MFCCSKNVFSLSTKSLLLEVTVCNCPHSAYFGQANSDVPILLDDVRCTGQEASITDCVRSNWYAHNCHHYEDAGVSCTSMLCHVVLHELYQNFVIYSVKQS